MAGRAGGVTEVRLNLTGPGVHNACRSRFGTEVAMRQAQSWLLTGSLAVGGLVVIVLAVLAYVTLWKAG